jgi:hypothetical protein
MRLQHSLQIFSKYSNVTFHENPYSENRVVTGERKDGRTDGQTDRQTDTTKLIVALFNSATAPTNECPSVHDFF